MERDIRIRKEAIRLKKVYKDIDKKKLSVVQGLIQRAAYVRISLEDIEVDIDENGFTEMFQQSEKQEPYERTRPIADMYNKLYANYLKTTKQLTDLLPNKIVPVDDDPFESFVNSREDV